MDGLITAIQVANNGGVPLPASTRTPIPYALPL
jgi:hypothetical protein